MFDKVIAKAVLYNGRCTVKGTLNDAIKLYLGLRRVLMEAGCDLDKVHEHQDGARLASAKVVRR